MQKKNLKASILIWAIFLSLIISVTFISISTKINKNLRNNSDFSDNIKINNKIKNIISSGIFTDQTLSNGDQIIFEESNEKIVGLKQNEIYSIIINEDSNTTISVINGGPIKYKNNISSGIIINNKTIADTNGNNLELTNLGGYTKLNITSTSNNNFLSQYKNYKIIKTIGNKKLIKTRGQIKNF